jgi:hypothetical protein
MLDELIREGRLLLDRIHRHYEPGPEALSPSERITEAEIEAWYKGMTEVLEQQFGAASAEAQLWRDGLDRIRRESWEGVGRVSPRGGHWVIHNLSESLGLLARIKLLQLKQKLPVGEPYDTNVLEPFQFYSCFISYSSKDEQFAQRLHADLQNSGVRCWFAPHDMQGGKKIHEQIDQAIREYEKVLLIISEHSIQSEWVKTEIANTRQLETKENRRILLPIRLVDYGTIRDWKCFDADTGKDSAREIREYFIPDFSQWNDPTCYKQAVKHLLLDLKVEEAKR